MQFLANTFDTIMSGEYPREISPEISHSSQSYVAESAFASHRDFFQPRFRNFIARGEGLGEAAALSR